MRRGVLIGLAALVLALMGLSVIGELWVLPSEIDRVTTTFPETEPHATIALLWGVAAITCCQLLLVMALRLVALGRNESKFRASAFRWARAMVGCLLLLVALIAAAMVLLSVWGYSSPLSFLLGIAGGIALTAAVAIASSRVSRRSERRLLVSPATAH
ncbi:DUF2975 domain-containing protein [Microbacterium sp. ZW T2_14]|uniref:DUF2975 domain-containing protein n=1 Tax=Microbacterium sp. ZW T2_14 TaxID=3378079 RepID=UPI003852F048